MFIMIKQRMKPVSRTKKLRKLLSDACINDKSELLTSREAFIVWLRDECDECPTFPEIGKVFGLHTARVRQIYVHAKLILSRGYKEGYYARRVPKPAIPKARCRQVSFLRRAHIKPKTIRQEIVETLEKDIDVFRAIVARFNSY